jgi:hypothetical protein
VSQETAPQAPAAPATPARALLPLILPALVVGVAAALLFLGVSEAVEALQHVLWQDLPDTLGVGRYSVPWMLTVLTATGVAVGLVVWKAPGHAGPDPATTGLDAPALPRRPAGTAAGDRPDARGRAEPRPGEPDHRRQCRAGPLARAPAPAPGAGRTVGGAGGGRDDRRAVRHAWPRRW